jgi:preprotein translocase subunit SecG
MGLSILEWVTIISGILMSIFILAQTRGASLGAGFGSSSELYTTRRGADKTMMQITIVLAIIFAGSIIVSIASA